MRLNRKPSSLPVWPANASGPAAPSPALFAGRGNRRSGARFSRREAGVRCAPLLCGHAPGCGTGRPLLFSKLKCSMQLQRQVVSHLMKVARHARLFQPALHLSWPVLLALPFGRGDLSHPISQPSILSTGERPSSAFRSLPDRHALFSAPFHCGANLPSVMAPVFFTPALGCHTHPFGQPVGSRCNQPSALPRPFSRLSRHRRRLQSEPDAEAMCRNSCSLTGQLGPRLCRSFGAKRQCPSPHFRRP